MRAGMGSLKGLYGFTLAGCYEFGITGSSSLGKKH